MRPVRPEDHATVARLTVAAYRALPGQVLPDDYAAELADVAARAAEAEVLVATVARSPAVGPEAAGESRRGPAAGREVVGSVAYVPGAASPLAEMLGPDEAGVRMLAVDPAYQGGGAGRALLAACVERARAAGKTRLALHSTEAMAAAHRLYERAGFRREPARDWYPVPGLRLLGFVLDL